MPRDRDDESWGEYASPPCFPHELNPSYVGLAVRPPASRPDEVALWRKAERERLIRERRAIASEQRRQWDASIIGALEQVLGETRGALVSAYWPFRGEPDLRSLLSKLTATGARTALPVVVAKGKPLLFREWKQGDRLERGIWNIPYPADGEVVLPDIVIAPLVGFDPALYRLGYGGGFFDRTLAALRGSVQAIGVGYSRAEIPTIHPQPHDIAMSIIVTESFSLTSPKLSSRTKADVTPARVSGCAAPRSGA
jgi:5-formyltetrahydrofolate cyclo-ligase